MTDLIKDGQTMTSLQIAEVTGKQHKNVLRAIRSMEPAWEKVRGRKFALTLRTIELPNNAKREDPIYSLTKSECLYIATKFNDEARARLILRWEELECQNIQNLPQPDHHYTLETINAMNAALAKAEEKILRLNKDLSDKNRMLGDLERMASLENPQHSEFCASADFLFVTEQLKRILNYELLKGEMLTDLEFDFNKLKGDMRELSTRLKGLELRVLDIETEGGAL